MEHGTGRLDWFTGVRWKPPRFVVTNGDFIIFNLTNKIGCIQAKNHMVYTIVPAKLTPRTIFGFIKSWSTSNNDYNRLYTILRVIHHLLLGYPHGVERLTSTNQDQDEAEAPMDCQGWSPTKIIKNPYSKSLPGGDRHIFDKAQSWCRSCDPSKPRWGITLNLGRWNVQYLTSPTTSENLML